MNTITTSAMKQSTTSGSNLFASRATVNGKQNENWKADNEQWLDQPLRWKKPRKIFVCAHGDLFHKNVPDAWIDRVFAVMALCPQHTFQVLTKRPDRARVYMDGYGGWVRVERLLSSTAPSSLWNGNIFSARRFLDDGLPLPNVWLGTSISDQASADLRIPELLATPAAIRFVSAEPLLGPVDLTKVGFWKAAHIEEYGGAGHEWLTALNIPTINNQTRSFIQWVIVGGESGPKARPMHPDWARSIRDQCKAAGVAFLFKQWGEWMPRRDGSVAESNIADIAWPDGTIQTGAWEDRGGPGARLYRVGKKAAGRLLDGVTHDEFPGVR